MDLRLKLYSPVVSGTGIAVASGTCWWLRYAAIVVEVSVKMSMAVGFADCGTQSRFKDTNDSYSSDIRSAAREGRAREPRATGREPRDRERKRPATQHSPASLLVAHLLYIIA